MKPFALLARLPLFTGLSPAELDELGPRLRPQSLDVGEELCRAGEPGDSLFVLEKGLAHVLVDDRVVAKLRRGDVVGEMSLFTGEPRSATVVAALPTEVLELRQRDFAEAIGRSPVLLRNLNRILSQKLAATTAQVGVSRTRGEAVALVAGPDVDVNEIVEATRAAKVGSVATLDGSTGAQAVAELDDLLGEHELVLVTAEPGQDGLGELLDAVDRAVEVGADDDPARVGRHLARTKLGLALGAGGAKGYAHVSVLRAFEQAGYTVDYIAGSSIGAIVGALAGLGQSADEIEETMRRSFREENVAEIFKLSFSGTSSGLEVMTELLREVTQEKSFEDLDPPLVAMAVDLVERRAAAIDEGLLWPALLAATSVAGLFPPFERDGQRLVDGIALVPVPTDAARAAGADIVVSVNLISRAMLPAWPGEGEMPEAKPPGSRMLETLLEVMDLAQLDSSERHAARADVAITPLFGPCTWRDFHLAELFLEAGRAAAEQALPDLQALAKPQLSRSPT